MSPFMNLDRVPLFTRLAGAERILIAGAGGGHDVYAGLPVALTLIARGATVFFANLTWTSSAPPKRPGRCTRSSKGSERRSH
ncbi:hypothetical protein SAMN05421505_1158 [Sinosporangium album]|uniref:DUF1152 domain-containing protein n=1 Tax=Sinosporangium album TaxID=504805 RepID=A0A1G8BZM3_9ACTN|nr:hypothetical protein SAMN05421505_1158 [Sinosporangium album]